MSKHLVVCRPPVEPEVLIDGLDSWVEAALLDYLNQGDPFNSASRSTLYTQGPRELTGAAIPFLRGVMFGAGALSTHQQLRAIIDALTTHGTVLIGASE